MEGPTGLTNPMRCGQTEAICPSPHRRTSPLTKREYVCLASLRSFPYQQLRKLCVALQSRTLPLTEPAVHYLIRQTLGHLGPLDECSQLEWKTDMRMGDLLDVMCVQLRSPLLPFFLFLFSLSLFLPLCESGDGQMLCSI